MIAHFSPPNLRPQGPARLVGETSARISGLILRITGVMRNRFGRLQSVFAVPGGDCGDEMVRLQRRWTRRLQRLESVLQYIDAHGDDQIDVSALASMASISPFHFHRVFSSHVGEPVLAHIRRLRLEKAAFRLLFMQCSVTEAGALAGYSSPAAFTRAFRLHFGVTPKKFIRGLIQARPETDGCSAALPAGPEYRHIPELGVIGVKRRGGYNRSPWEAWRALRQFLRRTHPGTSPGMRVGIPLDWPEVTPDALRRYEACVESDAAADGEFFRKQVGGGTYAVFLHRGLYRNLQAAHESLFWHWFPRSGIRLREGPVLHIYLDPAVRGNPGSLRTEICIPVEMQQPARVVLQGRQCQALAGA
ncbi:MAG: AraC family transcriptional regulator [Gammaproteobacteria bacterium]|nr:AraC family transcriptional regulator [Gammaproteobacteria bacterium]